MKTEVAEIITNGRSVLRKSVSSVVERCKLKSVVVFKLECGLMPNVMAALQNIGGALCSTPQRLDDDRATRVPCSNAAKTRNQLKFAGVPQMVETISAVNGPKFTIL